MDGTTTNVLVKECALPERERALWDAGADKERVGKVGGGVAVSSFPLRGAVFVQHRQLSILSSYVLQHFVLLVHLSCSGIFYTFTASVS